MLRNVARLVRKVRAINDRYREPRIEMSPMVRWSLLSLRVYLILLVLLMLYKFATMVAA
jgi:hypothetical protein